MTAKTYKCCVCCDDPFLGHFEDFDQHLSPCPNGCDDPTPEGGESG